MINLMEMFGEQYRITFDPAYSPRNVPRDSLDPCMMQIPGRFGTIYPTGDRLAVEVDYHPKLAKDISRLPGVSCSQDGDAEKTYIFGLESFQAVSAIICPRKRRYQSESQREASIKRLASYQFKSE